jgi:hypothetical protein
MGKLVRSKKLLHLLEKSLDTRINNLVDTFLKLLYLIDYPCIHPCFASFPFLLRLICGYSKGSLLALLLNVMNACI